MLPTITSEEKLVNRLSEGDTDAFRKLFDLYSNKLFCFVRTYFGNDEQTQDIIQEVFITVWEQRKQLNPSLSFQAYIYKIAKNKTLNALRRLAIERTGSEVWQQQQNIAHRETEHQIVYADYEKHTADLIAQLPPKRQLIYQLSRHQGLTYREIAQQLGVSQNTVEVQMTKALKTLRQSLASLLETTSH